MSNIFLLIGVLTAGLLSIIGIALKSQKGYWLISGYNTMSAEKKKNVDIENLSSLMANFLFFLAGIILLAFVLFYLKQSIAAAVVLFLLFPATIIVMIRAQKYDGNTRNQDGSMKTKSKIYIGLTTATLVVISVGVAVLMYFSYIPAEYAIMEETLRISGMYGEELKFAEINEIALKDELPLVKIKRNGSNLGGHLKGYFQLAEIERAKLFVDTGKPPFIFLETSSGLRIINTEDSAKTEELYERLAAAWRESVFQ